MRIMRWMMNGAAVCFCVAGLMGHEAAFSAAVACFCAGSACTAARQKEDR